MIYMEAALEQLQQGGNENMTDEERQEQTLLALKVFHEGLEARGLLDDAQPHEVARLKRKVRQGDRAMQDIIELHTPLV